jgi:hypothetical protein
MAVKKKAIKPPINDSDIERVIKRGGNVSVDEANQNETAEMRFTLRIPTKLISIIDEERKKRIGTVSRNQWILEAISKNLPK